MQHKYHLLAVVALTSCGDEVVDRPVVVEAGPVVAEAGPVVAGLVHTIARPLACILVGRQILAVVGPVQLHTTVAAVDRQILAVVVPVQLHTTVAAVDRQSPVFVGGPVRCLAESRQLSVVAVGPVNLAVDRQSPAVAGPVLVDH